MPRRRTPLLAYSEYVSRDDGNSTQVWQARLELIETAERVYPIFVRKLLAEGFPSYRDLANTGYDIESILWGPSGTSAFELLPEESHLKLALRNWAAEFNVICQSASQESAELWLMDEALRTLRDWFTVPEWRDALRWHVMHSSDIIARGESFEFHFMGWQMQQVTWTRYSQMAHDWFETELADYQKKARELAQSCGLIKAQKKYSPDNLEWFVLYQFAGWSSTKIAHRWASQHKAVDDSTVLKGVRAAAKLVAWDRLRSRPQKANRKIR
jgi:hypothetical protein